VVLELCRNEESRITPLLLTENFVEDSLITLRNPFDTAVDRLPLILPLVG